MRSAPHGAPAVTVLSALVALAGLSGVLAGDGGFPRLKGPYLGQTPPGLTPQLFAPGIIVDEEYEGSSGFALGGTVYLFQKFRDRRSHTYVTYLRDGHWTAPELIPFWETMAHNGDFVISSDEQTMLYQVKTESGDRLVSNLWRVEVKPDGWGQRVRLPAPVNTAHDESFASEADNKNLYFFSRRPGGAGQSDLYMSRLVAGEYTDPVNLESLNTEHHEWDPFIAPDESYLIFCSTRPEGLGRDDLYISFRDESGHWSPPVHMGDEVNSPQSENRPYVTVDGKYFFFTSIKRGNRDIYWVSAEILDRFKGAD